MKICHLTSVHESDDNRILYRECVSLAAAGYDTYLVAKGKDRDEKGVHIVGVGDPPAGRIKRMIGFSNKVYKKALELDAAIYHIHDPELLPFALKLKRHGKSVIFDSHEDNVAQIKVKQYIPSLLRNAIAFLYERYESNVLKKIDAAIFPCMIDGKHLFEGKCELIETIDNFAEMSELYDKYDDSIPKLTRSFAYVGSLTHDRGVTNLVKAMEQVNGTMILAGPFSSEEYLEELKKMPGWSKVEYRGILNREHVQKLLSECVFGASTILSVGQYNKTDNLCTKSYEYMAMGLPVLSTKSSYNDWINEKYRFGINVDPENIKELAKAINYLFDNPEEVKKMGLNGRKAVREEFNWGTQEKKLLALYEKLS